MGLVQINNSFSVQNYLPYSIACLRTYKGAHEVDSSRFTFIPMIYKRMPIGEAFISEEIFPTEYHRSRWSREQLRLWVSGARDLYYCCAESAGATPSPVALRYCQFFPGILTPREVDLNIDTVSDGPLSLGSCREVEALHVRQSFVVRQ